MAAATSPATVTPTLVEPMEVKLLGQVEGGRVTEETPAGKKKETRQIPKALHLMISGALTTSGPRGLGVHASSQVVYSTCGTSKTPTVTQPAEVFTSANPVQATGDVAARMTATQPVDAPGTMMESAASMTATQPVEATGTRTLATQPVEAPSARSEVHSQHTGTGSVDVSAANTGVSDYEDDLDSEPESPAAVSDQGNLTGTHPRTTSLTRSSLKRSITEKQ